MIRSFVDGLEAAEPYQCRDYHGKGWNSSTICNFMNTTENCQIDGGFVNYLVLTFCSFDSNSRWLAVTLEAIWLFFLFIGLGVTADTFFCPSLRVMADSLKLSQNIAGVTFLAFGNGAPDVFSAIAAISNAKDGDAGLAFGALFGAGVFVSTVVAGLICIAQPFQSVQRPLLRDLIFFLVAGFWAFYVVWDGRITLFETMGFLGLYVLYIFVVLFGRYLNRKLRERRGDTVRRNHFSSNNIQTIKNRANSSIVVNEDVNDDDNEEARPLLRNENSPMAIAEEDETTDYTNKSALLAALQPYDPKEWGESKFLNKTLILFKVPVVLLLKTTIPLVDYEVKNHNWNKMTYALNCLTAPILMTFAVNIGFVKLFNVIPLWSVALVVGVLLSGAILVFTDLNTRPRAHWLFAYFGFLVSVIWIYTIANEIVNLLTAFGVILNISNTILGLTFLAWGNSLSDLVADLFSAKRGFPDMGMSACFGGPLFNILLGVGIPFSIQCFKKKEGIAINSSFLQDMLALFLGISLVSTLIIIPLRKFKFTRGYGYYLLAVYAVFLTVCILIESGVIKSPVK